MLSKSLPDVALTETGVPEGYRWPKEELGVEVAHDEFGEDEIPVIDLGGLGHLDDQQRGQICEAIRGACVSWGFFQVVNHGVSLELLKRVQSVAKKFYELPLETKERLECKFEGDRMLGYGFPPKSSGSHKIVAAPRVWSEGIFVDIPRVTKFASVLWPEDDASQAEFSETLEEYFRAMRDLGVRLVRLIVNSLGVYSESYEKYSPKEPALVRLNHYPPCPDPSQTMGLKPHHDANLFTILHQGDVGGLQVEKGDRWVAVRPYPDAFAINAGNMLQAISNDICRSALHRAVVNRSEDRYSIAYFVQAPDWDQITPLAELVDAERPAKYRPFTWPEYLAAQVKTGSGLECFAVQ